MSDFASLLGQLRRTADQTVQNKRHKKEEDEEEDGKDNTENTNNMKSNKRRKRNNDDEYYNNNECYQQRRQTPPPLPRDIAQLSIQLSFLCIGAQKAGTSYLHSILSQSKFFVLPPQKEVHFWDWHRRKGLGWYSRQFPLDRHRRQRKGACSREQQELCGEITPCYMTLPTSDIQEIHSLFPKLKIIFIARGLVERAWSALCMELRNSVRGLKAGQFQHTEQDEIQGRTTTSSTTAAAATAAVQEERYKRESNPNNYNDDYFIERLEHSTHVQRSDYANGIKKYLCYFPKEQLFIVNYKQLSDQPKETLVKICTFLGLSKEESLDFVESLGEDVLNKRVNAAAPTTTSAAAADVSSNTKENKIRLSLRKKMERFLNPYAIEFNKLLVELGYDWQIEQT